VHYTPNAAWPFPPMLGRASATRSCKCSGRQLVGKSCPLLAAVLLGPDARRGHRAGRPWIRQCLLQLVKRLPERLRYVIGAYYGLAGQPASTMLRLACIWDSTKQRVCQLRTRRWSGYVSPPTRRPCAACWTTPWRITNGRRTWRNGGCSAAEAEWALTHCG